MYENVIIGPGRWFKGKGTYQVHPVTQIQSLESTQRAVSNGTRLSSKHPWVNWETQTGDLPELVSQLAWSTQCSSKNQARPCLDLARVEKAVLRLLLTCYSMHIPTLAYAVSTYIHTYNFQCHNEIHYFIIIDISSSWFITHT